MSALRELRKKRYRDYTTYLNSLHWRNLKASRRQIVGNFCEQCKRNRNIIGHHIQYRVSGQAMKAVKRTVQLKLLDVPQQRFARTWKEQFEAVKKTVAAVKEP